MTSDDSPCPARRARSRLPAPPAPVPQAPSQESVLTPGSAGARRPDRPFFGEINELRVYSRALSHGEVASLAGYTAGTVLSQPVLALLSTLSDTDLNDDEMIDFKDFALLANTWLDEVLWP